MVKAREIEGLDCDARVEDGARLVLLTRLDETLALAGAALDRSDEEGIHDMRVASRRLRSALKDFLPYLRAKRLKQARKSARALADALGRVRDAEVAAAGIAALVAECPAEIAGGLSELADEKSRLRDEALARLGDALDPAALESLRTEFETALDDTRGDDDSGKAGDGNADAETGNADVGGEGDDARGKVDDASGDGAGNGGEGEAGGKKGGEESAAGLSFRDAGREVIESRLAELSELSACIFDPTASRKLHDLRLAAKRLRYALELFSPCFGGSLRPFAKEIAHLQASLGELHDCDVWIEELGERLNARVDEGEAASVWSASRGRIALERRAGMWLLRRLARERARHYDDALARWHAWETFGLLQHLREHVARW